MASLKWIFGINLRNTCQSHETLNFSLNLIYAEKNWLSWTTTATQYTVFHSIWEENRYCCKATNETWQQRQFPSFSIHLEWIAKPILIISWRICIIALRLWHHMYTWSNFRKNKQIPFYVCNYRKWKFNEMSFNFVFFICFSFFLFCGIITKSYWLECIIHGLHWIPCIPTKHSVEQGRKKRRNQMS